LTTKRKRVPRKPVDDTPIVKYDDWGAYIGDF
jgi:hypothetical protein